MSDTRTPGTDQARQKKCTGALAAEWITLILSSLLIVGVAGAVGLLHLHCAEMQPASFMAEPQPAETAETPGSFYLPVPSPTPVTSQPRRSRCGSNCNPGEQSETAVFTIDLLAAGESEEGTAVFPRDPSKGDDSGSGGELHLAARQRC